MFTLPLREPQACRHLRLLTGNNDVAFSSSEECGPQHQALQFRVVSGPEGHKSILSQVHLLSVHNCLSPRQCVLP